MLILFILIPNVFSNMIWPMFYLEDGISHPNVIFGSFILEYIICLFILKNGFITAFFFTFIANLITTIIGYFNIRTAIALFIELISPGMLFGTFHPINWLFNIFLWGIINGFIEYVVMIILVMITEKGAMSSLYQLFSTNDKTVKKFFIRKKEIMKKTIILDRFFSLKGMLLILAANILTYFIGFPYINVNL